MDSNGGEIGQWTNEKHLHFLNSMEAAFVHTMLRANGRHLRLDRYLPDSSESTLDLKSRRPKQQSPSAFAGYNRGGRRNRLDRRAKRFSSSDHQSHTADSSQDQVVPQLENIIGDKNEREHA